MKKAIKSSIALMCVGALSACSAGKNNNGGITTLNSAGIVADQNLTPQQKSEKLALAGEQLATPTGFMYADTVLDQALAQDPNNKKAQFYKAFLAQPMALRGILVRIKPLAYSKPESKKQYDEAVKGLPNSGLKTFLFDGQEDIKTEKDAQAFFDEIYQAQDTFRKFLKANKTLELTLNVNDWAVPGSIKKAMDECAVNEVQNGVYEVKKCDLTHALEVKLNRADIEALQQITAGLQIYSAMLNSYDASGSVAVSEKFKGQQVSNKVVWKELTKNADFAKLRNSGSALKAVVGMGVDAVAGVRWAAQLQSQLCPNGEEAKNRAGFLFENGICIRQQNEDGTKLEDILKTVELALSGQTIEVAVDEQGNKTDVRPVAVLENPIKDLKELRPAFNSCDKIQAVSYDSIGGVFPRRDGNEVLANSSHCGY